MWACVNTIRYCTFFFQAEDGIRDIGVTGVQTCALPISAGVSVLWDLNKAVATFGYDHYTFIATNDDFDYLDRDAEMLTASVSVAATSTTGVGLEGAFVYNNYDRSEEHTSELQHANISYAVFCLKKKKK